MKEFRNTGYFVKQNGQIIGKRKTLKPTLTPYGYHSVCLYFDGKYKTFLVHRMVGECYIPNPQNKPEINHRDGNKLNNDITNLEWNTTKENVTHFYSNISNRKIGQHPNSKLSYDDMIEIYKWYTIDGIYQKELANKYGVFRGTISKAIKTIKNEMKSNR